MTDRHFQEIFMSHSRNPFMRDFQNLRITRNVCITCEDGQIIWRPLYPSQAYLPDDWIEHVPCVFNGDFVLIMDQDEPDDIDPEILDDLENKFPASGIARNVVYAITGDDDGQRVHIGNLDSKGKEAAQEIVRRLSFESGFYNRCWEISTAHLTAESERYLADMADKGVTGFLFIAFRIPHSVAIGVKLIATPWTDTHLHQLAGVPDALAEVLNLAALADTRILIFDANAPKLDGLPVYDNL
jgi:hypothetical protein